MTLTDYIAYGVERILDAIESNTGQRPTMERPVLIEDEQGDTVYIVDMDDITDYMDTTQREAAHSEIVTEDAQEWITTYLADYQGEVAGAVIASGEAHAVEAAVDYVEVRYSPKEFDAMGFEDRGSVAKAYLQAEALDWERQSILWVWGSDRAGIRHGLEAHDNDKWTGIYATISDCGDGDPLDGEVGIVGWYRNDDVD